MANRKCPDCNGTGRCKHCSGTGKKTTTSGGVPIGSKCYWCSTGGVYYTEEQGSGVCNRCQGRGEV